MPLYLSRFSYTPETWARLIGKPEDRREAARSYIESVGGTLHGFWYAFGEHDGYTLWEAPDNVSMAAVALATGGNTWAEGLDVVVEGVAVRVTDPAALQRLADAYEEKYGSAWHFDVGDGAFQTSEGTAAVFRIEPV